MFALNRRQERKPSILEKIKNQFTVTEIIDLSFYENENVFLEGTGSMVFDRENKIAYACLSPRTNEKLLDELCNMIGYRPVSFSATDVQAVQIYHTNVMMCIADKFAVVCLQAINNETEKRELIDTLKETNKAIVEITIEQLNHFAGNMLQVKNSKDELLLIMSTQAYNSLTNEQVQTLEKYNRIIHTSLDTIETAGGGSARCMMAEIFLEKK